MRTILIEENTPAGKRIPNEIAKSPQIGQINLPGSNLDENGTNPAGYITVDEYFSKLRETIKRKHQETKTSEV